MSKGHDRERLLKHKLEDEGWWVTRAAGSLGDADLVAARWIHAERVPPYELRLIEVKANKTGGPFKNFQPADRADLLAAAKKAGAEAWLAFWPAHKPLRWIPSQDWPT